MTVKISNKNKWVFCSESMLLQAFLAIFLFLMSSFELHAEPLTNEIIVGAERTEQNITLLKNRRVAVVAKPASRVKNAHLVDTWFSLGVNVKTVFAPEHGFRGEAEAGEHVLGGTDPKTGVRVISLYGDHKKPDQNDMEGIDIVLFDLQDVGVRFYTYISTLQYIMEACAEYHVSLIILDRPNPNAHYVDGPVLKNEFRSFVGMQNIPVVYGMTIAEYALMLNGEKWLSNGVTCNLQVVKLLNWDHSKDYHLPVAPSPNLPNVASIRLYPSLCFFEGTSVSLGRGTDLPFQSYGFPENKIGDYTFIPKSIKGKAKQPLYENIVCKGNNVSVWAANNRPDKIHLQWLLETGSVYPKKENYFNSFFNKLAGNSELRKQIEDGWSEEKIRASWEKDIADFRMIRMKYLLYP